VQYEELTRRLCVVGWHKALRLVHARRTAIEAVTTEVLDTSLMTGERLYSLLEEIPEDDVPREVLEGFDWADTLPREARLLGRAAESTFCVLGS
jgi:hypothetical protein